MAIYNFSDIATFKTAITNANIGGVIHYEYSTTTLIFSLPDVPKYFKVYVGSSDMYIQWGVWTSGSNLDAGKTILDGNNNGTLGAIIKTPDVLAFAVGNSSYGHSNAIIAKTTDGLTMVIQGFGYSSTQDDIYSLDPSTGEAAHISPTLGNMPMINSAGNYYQMDCYIRNGIGVINPSPLSGVKLLTQSNILAEAYSLYGDHVAINCGATSTSGNGGMEEVKNRLLILNGNI